MMSCYDKTYDSMRRMIPHMHVSHHAINYIFICIGISLYIVVITLYFCPFVFVGYYFGEYIQKEKNNLKWFRRRTTNL